MAKLLGTRRIYEGRIVNLRVDDVEYDNGARSNVEIVEHNGGVAIIAQPAPQTIVLVRQYRPAIGRGLWEVPAGKLESGEDPAACATRELIEETGYRCRTIRKLWSFFTAPGFCNERLHLFVAEGLIAGEAEPEATESLEPREFALDDAWAMVQRDEIPDAKTQVALGWCRARTL
ncbi:MAG TPA: NUDIX hydrolase [Candidatus Eremiobacteraceae bacterium]|nr:NUDIX hydrolase [Candidatus Eremiobacteraceae bacterium]